LRDHHGHDPIPANSSKKTLPVIEYRGTEPRGDAPETRRSDHQITQQ